MKSLTLSLFVFLLHITCYGQISSTVFINGLELHWQDVRNLKQWVGYVYPGRYWLSAIKKDLTDRNNFLNFLYASNKDREITRRSLAGIR